MLLVVLGIGVHAFFLADNSRPNPANKGRADGFIRVPLTENPVKHVQEVRRGRDQSGIRVGLLERVRYKILRYDRGDLGTA